MVALVFATVGKKFPTQVIEKISSKQNGFVRIVMTFQEPLKHFIFLPTSLPTSNNTHHQSLSI